MNEIPIIKIARRLRDAPGYDGPGWHPPESTPLGWMIDEAIRVLVPGAHDLESGVVIEEIVWLPQRRIIISYGPHAEWLLEHANQVGPLDEPPADSMWLHASISYRDEAVMPTYEDLAMLHWALYGGDGWSYQVFAPRRDHINIRSNALHLWGKLDGRAELPNFGALGSI